MDDWQRDAAQRAIEAEAQMLRRAQAQHRHTLARANEPRATPLRSWLRRRITPSRADYVRAAEIYSADKDAHAWAEAPLSLRRRLAYQAAEERLRGAAGE